MADTPSKLKRSALTRGKAALIGILAIVLVGVLYMQRGASDTGVSSEPIASAPRPRAPAPSANQPATSAAEKKTQSDNGPRVTIAAVVDETHWQSPNLADVVDYDPFALPATFPRPPVIGLAASTADGLVAEAAANDAQKLAEVLSRLQMQWEELQQRGVHIIVRERDQYVAVIGDRMVHVGDEINGYTITEIDPQGVHVERKVPQ